MFQGRGLDPLNRTLLITGLICAIVSSLVFAAGSWPKTVLGLLAAACLAYAVIRLLAGNPERRNRENMRYLTIETAVCTFFRNVGNWFANVFTKKSGASGTKPPKKERPRRAYKARKNPTWSEIKQYKYFICPQCAQRLRVPRGKGKIRVTCTHCGNIFETKS